jgi:hypothetical protein
MITNHPRGEEICEYLRNDTLAIGWILIPEKYRQTKAMEEEARAKKYEYHLRRGLPIPAELMPKDEREEMERKRLYNTDSKDDGAMRNGGFNPRMTMNIPPKRATIIQPKPPGMEEKPKKESKSWSDWFTTSK